MIDLFLTFLKIGVSTFGGGYAMVPVLERELIKKRGWITLEEVMDYYTIAQVTPGIIAVNISTFVGYKRAGIAGGILATAAFILPGVLFMTVISLFISRFMEYPAVRHAFAGIRVAVGALVLDTVRKLVLELFKKEEKPAGGDGEDRPSRGRTLRLLFSAGIFGGAFLLSVLLSPPPVWIVAGAGLAGFLMNRGGKKP
ncbi:MAG: chromate transporter [Treponema sp.]|jgi:chromate transporter|nr:chromate transporter [Treponema sp.]